MITINKVTGMNEDTHKLQEQIERKCSNVTPAAMCAVTGAAAQMLENNYTVEGGQEHETSNMINFSYL